MFTALSVPWLQLNPGQGASVTGAGAGGGLIGAPGDRTIQTDMLLTRQLLSLYCHYVIIPACLGIKSNRVMVFVKGAVLDVHPINIAVNKYLLCKDIVE